MQKKPDRLRDLQPPQLVGERDQMIIVHPDEIVGRAASAPRPARIAVDAQISGEVAPRKADQRRPIMKQRPQHAVGVADVVFLEIASRQVERRGGDVAGNFYLRRSRSAGRMTDPLSQTTTRPGFPARRGSRPPARLGSPCWPRSGRPGSTRPPAAGSSRATGRPECAMARLQSGDVRRRSSTVIPDAPHDRHQKWNGVAATAFPARPASHATQAIKPGWSRAANPAPRRPREGHRPRPSRRQPGRPGSRDRRAG